jgi:putative ABC transport system permease protein
MENLVRDVLSGWRMLAKSHGFAIAALFILAVGISADTAVFTVFNAILLRPLPYPDPDHLVAIREVIQDDAAYGLDWGNVAPANFADWRSQSDVFEQVGVFVVGVRDNLTGVENPESLTVVRVSPSFFSALGVRPALGWTPSEAEAHEGRSVILGDALWGRRFQADKAIVGKQVGLGGRPYTVVGVMPASFRYPVDADIWLSDDLEYAPLLTSRRIHYLSVIARLKSGVSLTQARAEMNTIATRLQQEHPGTNSGHGVEVLPLSGQLARGSKRGLLLLLGAAGMLLLITCASVANLLLARSLERQKEVAVRLATGATRGRLIRQLVTESLLLGLLGGGLGLLLALWASAAVRGPVSRYLADTGGLTMDARVFGFTLGVSLVTAVLFGVLPAVYATKAEVIQRLKEGGHKHSAGSRHHRAMGWVVIFELIVTSVLLTTAGLLIGSLVDLLRTNPGYDPKGLLSVQVRLNIASYRKLTDCSQFKERLSRQLVTIPGVESVTVADGPPEGDRFMTAFSIEGDPPGGADTTAQMSSVMPGYFQTMQIPLLLGREFAEWDRVDSTPVVVVNQTLASTFFGDRSPLGARIMTRLAVGNPPPVYEIIGVAADVRDLGLDSKPAPEMYFVEAQRPSSLFVQAFVRTSVTGRAQISSLIQAVKALDGDVPVEIRTMEDRLFDSAGRSYFGALLLTVFAGISLAISAIGIYGIVSYSAATRKGEFAIKLAVGAERSDILKDALRQGLVLGLVGTGIGILASLLAAPLLRAFLYGLPPSEPRVLAIISGVLLCVALVASTVPAYRVSRIDPVTELRRN